MIKPCEVLAFNKVTHIVIAKYDEMRIQFVTDKDFLNPTVYIKKVASNFEIVEKSEYEKSLKVTKKKEKIDKNIISDDENIMDDSELN